MVALATGLALVTVVAACAADPRPAEPAGRGGTPKPGPTVSVGPIPVVWLGAQLQLPLDPYLLGPQETAVIARAYRVLVAKCVQDFGMTTLQSDVVPDVPRTLNERRYGITDPTQASTAGFRLSANASTVPAAKATDTSADPALLNVLTGKGSRTVHGRQVPDGGCSGQAQRQVDPGASGVADRFLAQRMAQETFGRSRQDPLVQSVVRDWSACMAQHGFTYAGPLDAPADPRFRGALSAVEIAAAEADIGCKRTTNLVGVWSAVESAYQDVLLTANQSVLDQIRTANQTELAVARSLVA